MTTRRIVLGLFIGICTAVSAAAISFAAEPGFVRDVQPLLRKYCAGCHNEADKEGDFSVASYDALLKGTPDAKVIVAGDAKTSRILNLIRGQDEPKMPPAEEAQPTAREIQILEAWIAAGAKNDASKIPLEEQITTPALASDATSADYITAMTDAGDSLVALAGLGKCELHDAASWQVTAQFAVSGKINQLRTSASGKYLLIAGGIPGVGGQVVIVDLATRTKVATIQGHTDAIYCATLSPDDRWLCTGSYDRQAILWDWQQQKAVRQFSGHNGAIYDLDIDKEGKVLATASADQTVKLWGVADGQRLDTLGQPEGEMLCVRFALDGNSLIASGADKQLRVWQIVSKDKPAINPLRLSRYAHEEPVTQMFFRGNNQLLSLSEDRTVKLWQLPDLKPLGVVATTRDIPVGVGKLGSGARQIMLADYRGTVSSVTPPTVKELTVEPNATASQLTRIFQPADKVAEVPKEGTAEVEPNNDRATAAVIPLPAKVVGSIASEKDGLRDVDLVAIDVKQGQRWVIEVRAARDKSPLDSLIDVLDSDGAPVLRTRLQAVRESYFTFRGKDSNTSDDYRLHKWQEMELNELLYAGGEVVKLWLYPRGPDSGFKVYPGYGSRNTFFDTTPTAHALGEVTYVVRELEAGAEPLPNGLPVFPIYYQNDDDGSRRWGKDSRLTFVAPQDGRYFIRLRDARGFGGEDFKYQLIVRPEQPDFELEFKANDLQMPAGSGREWQVVAKRLDGLDSPIEIHLENVPEGFVITNPLVIEAGQDIANGNAYALPDAKLPEGQDKLSIKLRAVSRYAGGEVVHDIEKPLTIALKKMNEVQLKLVDNQDLNRELEELVIRPGETISASVVVSRGDHKGPISLGKEDAGRNLPHGCFVDNIGLNGLLITDDNSQREFFITAAKWLEPQERVFHLRSETKNNPTSRSIRLRVIAP